MSSAMLVKNCRNSVVYPELVPRGVSKSHKSNWLVKVGAGKAVTPWYKTIMAGGGGFPGNQKTHLDTPLEIGQYFLVYIWYG